MKVIAHYQFYLPYLLPRHEDWKGQRIELKTPEFQIVIIPRSGEDPVILENDRGILSLRLQTKSVADVHSVRVRTAEDECCDRIHVAVIGDVLTEVSIAEKPVREKFLEAGIDGANIFIDHCRVLSGQPSMKRLSRSIVAEDMASPEFPYSVWWQEADTQKWFSGSGSAGSAQVLLHNSVSWKRIVAELDQSITPDLSKCLMLDARQRFYEEDFREAVLAMAMACEVASNFYIERMGAVADATIEKILGSKASFAKKRFDEIPIGLSSRSFKTDEPKNFASLEALYRLRNTVVHEGVVYDDERITDHKSEIRVLQEHLGAAEAAMRWLEGLQPTKDEEMA